MRRRKRKFFPRSGNKESTVQGPAVESFEVEVTAIHDVEGARLRSELIQHIDIVNARRSNANKRGNLARRSSRVCSFKACCVELK